MIKNKREYDEEEEEEKKKESMKFTWFVFRGINSRLTINKLGLQYSNLNMRTHACVCARMH